MCDDALQNDRNDSKMGHTREMPYGWGGGGLVKSIVKEHHGT